MGDEAGRPVGWAGSPRQEKHPGPEGRYLVPGEGGGRPRVPGGATSTRFHAASRRRSRMGPDWPDTREEGIRGLRPGIVTALTFITMFETRRMRRRGVPSY